MTYHRMAINPAPSSSLCNTLTQRLTLLTFGRQRGPGQQPFLLRCLFVITNSTDFYDGMLYSFDYVRDKNGEEWYLLWKVGAHTGDSFKFWVFEGTASGGGNVLAKHEYDIGPDIVAGAGWHAADSRVKDIGVDWANSQIHILDGGAEGATKPREGRIHVFTVLGVPPPPKGTAAVIR
ncbi:MAG: hypothetical protein ACUVWX_02640 [Kiritimatiellia bacterium]